MRNPFAEYSWFNPSSLETEEEEEAMQYEMKIFKENRVTKGGNPYIKTDRIEAQLSKEGDPIPGTAKKPEKMIKQTIEAHRRSDEYSKEQAQIFNNIQKTKEKRKQKGYRKDNKIQTNVMDLEDELSDSYSGDTPHLSDYSDKDSESDEEENEANASLFECCNFDKINELDRSEGCLV